MPDSPEDCPVCKRTEQTLMTNPVLRKHLSETEIVSLVESVQSAILNKEVKKTERGINMADEKYVISKASFEDFYETQDTLVSIMEKMVDRIEKQDRVIMKFGAALADVMADDSGMAEELPEGMPQEAPVDDGADLVEGVEELPEEEGMEGSLEEVVSDLQQRVEQLEGVEAEEVEGEEAVVPDSGMMDNPVPTDGLDMEKAAFEAGYKAAFTQLQKKEGVTLTPLEVPTSTGARPVLPSTSPTMGKTLDSLSEKELANMTPNQTNTWLRENKLYR